MPDPLSFGTEITKCFRSADTSLSFANDMYGYVYSEWFEGPIPPTGKVMGNKAGRWGGPWQLLGWSCDAVNSQPNSPTGYVTSTNYGTDITYCIRKGLRTQYIHL